MTTQQRRMRAELVNLNELAMVSSRAKSEFLASMSHELRAPLTSIRGSLGLLLRGTGGEISDQGKSLIKIGVANSDRLLRMINDTLDVEQIETGKINVSLEASALGPILKRSVEMSQGYLPEKNIIIDIQDEYHTVQATIDPGRLEQVWLNLLSNALKFSLEHSRVTVGLQTSDSNKVEIFVQDQRPGVPGDFKDRIFKKFEQAETGDARSKNGSGLGLSIAKALVEAMNGTIRYDRLENSKTTFYVEFPMMNEGSSAEPN